MFASIFSKTNYTFDGKRPEEKVLVFRYSHWFTLFSKLLSFFVLALLPFALYFLVGGYLAYLSLQSVYWFLIAVYFSFWWLGLAYAVTMYFLNMWIVTDHRVLASEQHYFFNRTLAEMGFARIQDTSVRITGMIPTFLDFGDLEIQSAGAVPKLIFRQVPRPHQIRELVNQMLNAYEITHQGGTEIHGP